MTMNLHQSPPTGSGGTQAVPPTGGITCKLEDGPIVVKPEADAHLYMHSTVESRDKSYDKMHVHAPHPNFSLNPKVLEPETSISPARGSTGLPMPPPTQGSAAQPTETHMIRRARVGKSMAREMMMQPHHHHNHGGGGGGSGAAPGNHHHVMHSQTLTGNGAELLNCSRDNQLASLFNGNKSKDHQTIEIKQELDLIKKEDMKVERDDDVVLLEKVDEPPPIKQRMTLHNSDKTKQMHMKSTMPVVDLCGSGEPNLIPETEIINLVDNGPDDEYTSPNNNVRKRKILELNRHQCKKSPPNSYKSLIKQSEPKPYLCTAEQPSTPQPAAAAGGQSMPKRSRYRLIKGGQRYRTQQRKIIINGKHKKLLITSSKKIKRRILKRKRTTCEPIAKVSDHSQSIDLTTSSVSGDDADPMEEPNTDDAPKIPSDSDIIDISPSQTTAATMAAAMATSTPNADPNAGDQRYSSEKQLFMSKLELLTDADAAAVIAEKRKRCSTDENLSLMILNRIQLNDRRRFKSETKKFERDRSKSTSKSKDRKSTEAVTKGSAAVVGAKKGAASIAKKGKKPVAAKTQHTNVSEPDAHRMLDEYTDSIMNNNNIMYDNNNKLMNQHHHTHQPAANGRCAGTKKSKSRGAKFSSRKRRRVRHVQEVEEVLIPRRTTAVPRWSNGWHWEGPSFKGKVFLNVSVSWLVCVTWVLLCGYLRLIRFFLSYYLQSDDSPVVRTRYLCMRHDSGDVIQPGDSVLLKAGSKRNELPYVAKVASLWENPEDGKFFGINLPYLNSLKIRFILVGKL